MASRAVLLVPLCATVLSRSRIGAAVQPQPCGAGDLAALRRFSAGLDAAVDGWRLADRRQGANASNNACCSWPRVTCGEAKEGAAAVVGSSPSSGSRCPTGRCGAAGRVARRPRGGPGA